MSTREPPRGASTAVADAARAERRLLRAAADAFGARDFEAAHRACMAVLGSAAQGANAHHAEALLLLAGIALEHGNAARAEEVALRALAIPGLDDPLSVRLLACASRAASAQRLHDAALEHARRGAALGPTDAHACDTFGVALARAGDHAAARPLFARAVERAPANASYRYNLATALQFTGELAAAEQAYRRTLALDPARAAAYPALAQLCEPGDDALLADIERTLSAREAADDADGCLLLGHALATLLERRGDEAAAMQALARAKRRKRDALRHDPGDDARLFEAASALLRDRGRTSMLADDAPIFVCGLPRSGTTLVERILGSHPQVQAAGELGDFSAAAKSLAGTPGAAVLDVATLHAAAAADPAALGQAYLARTLRHRMGAPHFVDKMPLNFLYAALIHRALPNARMVILHRQPMDACLGNYRQLFGTRFSYYNYAFDLAHTARYVACFEQFLATLGETLPADRLHVVDYDALVANQETQTRRLLAFCELPWDPACLQFHRNADAVATASSVQVRQPLYTGASGRWHRWDALLAPARQVFADAGIDITSPR